MPAKERGNAVHPESGKKQVVVVKKETVKFSDGTEIPKSKAKELNIFDKIMNFIIG